MAPVRAVARATHSLAAGAYTTRVHTDRQDDIGQLAQDFNQLALTLERNEQLRRNYIADISHELRTPLAVLQGELEAMEDGIHPATPQAFAMLQQEVHSLSKLVNDLHELSMADLGALQYKKEPLDLAALVERESQGFVARCKDLGLELDLPPPAPSPLMVQADPNRLRQLIHNLLSNSARYTQAPGRLQVSLQREGGNAVLDIQDSAPGVDAALLPKLFERFFRVESSRSRSGGGSGLGLSICESIVLAHAGSIRAMPSPLGGLWIQVQLPLTPTQPTLS
jgi:two-component system sensor histidine kinase BaeS